MVEVVARSLLVLALVCVLVGFDNAVAFTLSSRLIHRFSDEAKALRVSRNANGKVFESWPQRRTFDYYQVLVASDFQRQKMKLGSQFQYVFPSEGSKTMSFGNDFGWLHYTWVDIGTPNVSFLVALDAGSDLLWVPCDCIQCAPLSASYYSTLVHAQSHPLGISLPKRGIYDIYLRAAYLKRETNLTSSYSCQHMEFLVSERCSLVFGASIMQDRDLNQYNPSGSSTSKHLSCSHRLCELGANCKSAKQSCPYSVDYYTENTSSSGLLVEDILHLAAAGGDDSTNGSIQAPVVIGCGMKQSGGYLDGVAPDGLMGLGPGEISVPSFLSKAGFVRNSFSLCFDEDDSGRIFFGDQGPVHQQSTSFLTSNGTYETYMVGVEACCIGNSCLEQSGFTALVDSGTSFTFLPQEMYDKVSEEFDRRVNATSTTYEGSPWKYCYKTSSQELPKVPSVTLMFPANNSFVIHDPVFMVYGNQGASGFCLAIQPANEDIGTIGQNFMTGYRMVFDREALKLGWSNSNCQDLSDAKNMTLNPPKGTPSNPLPTNEQQRTPGDHAVTPAVAVRAPSEPSAASTQLISPWICLLRFPLLIVLICLLSSPR